VTAGVFVVDLTSSTIRLSVARNARVAVLDSGRAILAIQAHEVQQSHAEGAAKRIAILTARFMIPPSLFAI
jgi:hypothetical protein